MRPIALIYLALLGFACSDDSLPADVNTDPYIAIRAKFAGRIEPSNLANYANQPKPAYITKDNSNGNPITDKGATLGRVLFYDLNLSSNNTRSCASCHRQKDAFSDTALASSGVNGTTGRHSMRLVNSRFASEARFFWDERAATLEIQTTMPIKDHGEMGFSGTNGAPDYTTLITKLSAIDYYKELFKLAYGTEDITENKMQLALAQFVRSIQSFDAKYDVGRAQVANDNAPFPNFTQQENTGKNLFINPPQFNQNGQRIGGGLGCGGCHRAPEFDIDPASLNNGIIGNLAGLGIDLANTRSPSLRDLVKPDANGTPNGPMMHTGIFRNLQGAVGHYGNIATPPTNTNLDPRLRPNGRGQNLNLTAAEVDAVIAFIKTLSGTNVYVDEKWSDPFGG